MTNNCVFALLLTISFFHSIQSKVNCGQCEVIAKDISHFAANATSVEQLVKELEDNYCAVKYKGKPVKKVACDAVAKGLGSLINLAYKEISTLAWDSVNLCAVAGLCKVHCCGTETIPEQVHLALTSSETSMSVGWTTLNNTDTHTVQYGLDPENLNETGSGSSTTYDHFGWVGHLHNSLMNNLLPNGTKYYYRVGDTKGGWSKVWTFKTLFTDAGSDAHPLVMASVGDMGYGPRSDHTVAAIEKLVDEDKIDFVFHNGDISYADGEFVHWDVFMRKIETIAARVPYMVTPGNHEFWFNFSAYKHRFVMPDGGANDALYHGRVIGNGVHIVGMDTESWWDEAWMTKREVSWITNEFKNSLKDNWRIAAGHRPFYASNHGGQGLPRGYYYLRKTIEKELNDYNVDLVIQAHEHDYERTWPVSKNGTIWETDYTSPKYPVYIVNGAAGNREAEPTPPGKRPWQPQNQNFTNFMSFGLMTVKSNSLQWQQICSVDRSIQDSFTITK
jgi:hypothetical protein